MEIFSPLNRLSWTPGQFQIPFEKFSISSTNRCNSWNVPREESVKDRPKYIAMKPEQVAKLPPEERQEYEDSLKITKTPKRYTLRNRPY